MPDTADHVSERFARLLALYRNPDGSGWGGQDPESATGGLEIPPAPPIRIRPRRGPPPRQDGGQTGEICSPPEPRFDPPDANDRVPGQAPVAARENDMGTLLERATAPKIGDRRLLPVTARGIAGSSRGTFQVPSTPSRRE